MSAAVRQVRPPRTVRELTTLPRVNYCDAYLFDEGSSHQEGAEELIREILEGAPAAVRAQLRSGWLSIGLRVGTGSEHSVLGWQILRSLPDQVLLGAESRIGMPGQLLLKKHDGALLFATFVAAHNLAARALWAAVEPIHVRVVCDLLSEASRRLPS